MRREISVKDAIDSRLINGDGFNKGYDNSFTVDDIMMDIGEDDESKKYAIQVQINQVLKGYRKNKILAGSIGRAPSHYLIADTLDEERELLSKYLNLTKAMMKGVNGRANLSLLPAVEGLVVSINGMMDLLNNLTGLIEAPSEDDDE
jgi:hypothetical protein